MAIISLIQGTDSLSSSRVTLNDNFTAINDELTSVTSLLDPTTTNLTGVNNIEATAISVAGGDIALGASAVTIDVATEVSKLLTASAGVVYGSVAVSTSMPGALGYTSSTYVVDGNSAPSVSLAQAEDGQEITIIATNAMVTVDASLVAGVSTIELDPAGTITLRYVGSNWYVIAASPININIA
jgi:hypothetical protein